MNKKITTATLPIFDMAAQLDSNEAISEYLSQVQAEGDSDELKRALGYVANAYASLTDTTPTADK